MKKVYLMIAMLFVATFAYAEVSVDVVPQAVSRFYADADNSIGASVSAEVKGLTVVPLYVYSGVEKISTEANSSQGQSLSGSLLGIIPVGVSGSQAGGVDLDLTTWNVGLGYDYAINDKFTVTPYASLDFVFVSAEGLFEASNEVGRSLGVKGSYKVSDRVSIFVGAGYQWLETTLSSNTQSVDVDLDNFNLQSGLIVSF